MVRTFSRTHHDTRRLRGFSLIELMVVSAIFMVLSSVVLSANTRFGNRVILQNLAHEMALTVREAQVYGIAVRRFGTTEFDVAYGMHFELAAPETYELFADANNSGTSDDGDGVIKETTLRGGFSVSDICVRTYAGATNCGEAAVDVVFRRPEPDACISVDGVGTYDAEGDCTSNYNQARIVIEGPTGATADIVVESSGQISVQ